MTPHYIVRNHSTFQKWKHTLKFQNNHKSINPSSEVSYINYKNYPLIPEVQNTVADGSNQIESDKYVGWIRGGLPSREYARDQCNVSS